MTRLFSSFDFHLFFWGFSFATLTFWVFPLSNFYSHGCKDFLFDNIKKFLSSFFTSLRGSNSYKFLEKFIVYAFSLVFLLNFWSIFSYNFPFTSQLSWVLFASGGVWARIMLFSLFRRFKRQLSHFIPEGAPMELVPFLFLIEMVSCLIRPLTLTVRLLANILAGHLLIILLTKLVISFYWGIFLLRGLSLVELFVSIIQSYIFVTLICLYQAEL